LHNLVGIQGVLLLVYTAGIMFVLRQFFAGALVKNLSPLGLLATCSFVAFLGLMLLSKAQDALGVMIAATLFGWGKSYLWPTMLGVVAERFPKGGALLLGLLGGAGMFCVGSIMTPAMGKMQDHFMVESLGPRLHNQVLTDGVLDQRKLLDLQVPKDKRAVLRAKQYSASMTLQTVAILPAILALVFAFLYFYFRSDGKWRWLEQAEALRGEPLLV
jgi:hypothetical protein